MVEGFIALMVAAHNSLCVNHALLGGTEEQKSKYLVPMAVGAKLGVSEFNRA